MVNKTQYNLTEEQAKEAIKMCLDNARSYLDDVDMYISNNKTDHLAISIAFAMEEIGKAKIIFNKTKGSSEITLSYIDGIYSHETKMKQAISMINLDMDEKMAESLMLGDDPFDYLLDPLVISRIISKERELKNSGKQGHKIRLTSSFVDFDPATNEPKIERDSRDLTGLIKRLSEIITEYPSSFY